MECDRSRAKEVKVLPLRVAHRIDFEEHAMKSKNGYLCDADGFTGHVGDINPFKTQMPSVMVLKYYPELSHSQWSDFHHQKRTVAGLLKYLRQAVKRGEFVGYRFITIHKEVMGVEALKGKP